jgi:tetraacyldisaccharide 4'-kinase
LGIKDKSQHKIIITTEKDFVRLKGSLPSHQLFYLPIKSTFLSGAADFDSIIKKYLTTSSKNL